METTYTSRPGTTRVATGAVLLVLGLLLSLPWFPALIAALLLGKEPSLLVYLVVAIWLPLVLGRLLLHLAQDRLPQRWARGLSCIYLILGGLWSLTLAGPLFVLNLLSPEQPIGPNLLLGITLPLVGLFFISQAGAIWPEEKVHLDRLGGWIYLGVAGLEIIPGAMALLRGAAGLAVLWFFLAAFTLWLAAKCMLPVAADWSLWALGGLLAIPWLPVVLVFLAMGPHIYTSEELAALGIATAPPLAHLGLPLPLAIVSVVGLIAPLLAGLILLPSASHRSPERAPLRACCDLALAGLWGLCGPLTVLNLLYVHLFVVPATPDPLLLLLLGAVPPLLGLLFLRQGEEAWPEGRDRLRRLFGWIYLGLAAAMLAGAVVALFQGQILLTVLWLFWAGLTAWMACYRGFPAISRWSILALAVLLALPWLSLLPLTLAMALPLGELPSPPVFVLVWLGLPLVAGLSALRWAYTWLREKAGFVPILLLALGTVWTFLGPLPANLFGLLAPAQAAPPLAFFGIGAAAILVGLVFLAQARGRWKEPQRARGLLAYLLAGGAGLQAIWGIIALAQGNTPLALVWLVLAALAGWLAIAQGPAEVAGWILTGLGTLLSVPWAAAVPARLAWGHPLSIVELLLGGLAPAVVIGLLLLLSSRRWLGRHARALATIYRALGLLWALAGPLSAANIRSWRFLLAEGSVDPLGLLLVGLVPPIVGLLYLGQANAVLLAGRATTRRLGGWAYLVTAVIQVGLGLLSLAQGEPLFLLSWLAQAAGAALMAALQFEMRTQVGAALLIGLGFLIPLIFLPGIQPTTLSTFVLDPVGAAETWSVPNASFPTDTVIILMTVFAIGLGAWQALHPIRLARWAVGALLAALTIALVIPLALRHGPSTGVFILIVLALALGLSAIQLLRAETTGGPVGAILFLFIMAFLVWASRGRDFNFTGMLIGTLEAATPIALGALSGVWCERSAVINIAIEGMMLSGAFAGVVVGSATGSQFIGLLGGMLVGVLLGALLAVLSIRFKVNQIIAGTAINIFATGLTSYLAARWLAENQQLNSIQNFARIPVPVLSRIPVLGPVLFQNNLMIYLMLVLVLATHVILFYTRWGLRSRSVGEHPLAADTLGVNVNRTRYINVLIGGLIAGLGGAYFTLGSVGRFDEVMTAGRGFIGLAAMIFGRWTPVGGFGSSLIFGFAQSLQMKLSLLNVPIPSNILLMAPYLATIIVLAGVVGRAVAPAADGQVYEKH